MDKVMAGLAANNSYQMDMFTVYLLTGLLLYTIIAMIKFNQSVEHLKKIRLYKKRPDLTRRAMVNSIAWFPILILQLFLWLMGDQKKKQY